VRRFNLSSYRFYTIARCLACFAGALALVFFDSDALAETYTVNNNGDPASGTSANCAPANATTCTLRDAIAAATSGSDTISFIEDMAITVGSTLQLDKSVTIDATDRAVAVDGNHSVEVFAVNFGSTVQMTALTIQNGYASEGVYGNEGGGISVYGVLTLTNCTLSGNGALAAGGAIFIWNGQVNLINSVLSDNASVQGGAIQNQGTLNSIHSKLSGNTGLVGGAIINVGVLNLTDSTLSGNSAVDPVSHGGQGGGIFNAGWPVTLINSTVSENSADQGGGIFDDDSGTVILTNSTVSGNHATTLAGGILSVGQYSVTLTNSTVSGNTAAIGSGIYTQVDSVILVNSIVGDGCGGEGFPDDLGGNLDSGTSCGLSAATSKSNASLNLGPLQYNGGPTQTMLPGPSSAAINFTVCTSAPLTDQRGYSRPDPASVGLSTPCDAGAVEVDSVLSDRIFSDGFGPPPVHK